MSEIVVYTAIIGAIDDLHIPPVINPTVRYVCITDRHFDELGPWEIAPIKPSLDNARRLARFYKILVHRHFPEASYSIWIDGNMCIAVDPRWAVQTWLRIHDLALFAHPQYDCPYRESKRCIKRQKDDPALIRSQMARYRAAGYPAHNGLVNASVVLRRHTPQIARLNELWWSELSRYSVRDQLSFNYVAHQLGINWATIPGDRKRSAHFTHFKHKIRVPPSSGLGV